MPIRMVVNVEEHLTLEMLDQLGERAQDMRPVWRILRYDYYRSTKDLFDAQPWLPLAKSTVKRRGSATPILRVSNTLYDSLTRGNAKGSRWHEGRDDFFVGSDNPYGEFHVTGTKNMPARNPKPDDITFERRIGSAIEKYLVYGDTPYVRDEGGE